MSDSFTESDSEPGEPSRKPAAPELPPVEPPSAGFIVQLFLVPALIVIVVLAVWVLFGRMASSDQDWQTLVAELRSDNTHRRWRGAHELAQLLQSDARQGDSGQQLARNPQIAGELTEMLRELLAESNPSDDVATQRVFLIRALRLLDAPNTVFPILVETIDAQHENELRREGLESMAVVLGREGSAPDPPVMKNLLEAIVAASSDGDPLIRHRAAFALGLTSAPGADERLVLLLKDSDAGVQLNAAIGLARKNSTAGFPVFKSVLEHANEPITPEGDPAALDAAQRQRLHAALRLKHDSLKNTLHAVTELAGRFSDEEKASLRPLIEPVSSEHGDARMRLDAAQALKALR